MKSFAYRRPTEIGQAVDLLAAHPGGAPLSGGMSLLPILKFRLVDYPMIVDLTHISTMRGITVTDESVTIAAATPHIDVASAGEVAQKIPALAQLAGGIGDPQVRNRGTIGGSLANADPAADYPAAALALGATILTNRRNIAADDFFLDLFTTALIPGEIITGIRFPIPKASAYAKFRSPASRYAVVGVFVARTRDSARVAVTGAGPKVFRLPEMEEALAAAFSPASIVGITVPEEGLNGDIHADPGYRAHLIGVMARRAVAQAV